MKQVEQEGTPVIDVDGSYLYRKYKKLDEAGRCVQLPPHHPPPPISGWITLTNENHESLAPTIPPVTQGLVYMYLAGLVGHMGDQGAFRALARGYTHWASGRLEEIQINTNNPEYCHVQCKIKPSMKVGVYNVYILLGKEGELASIHTATCGCAAGQSASSTHVSALLHALSALNSTLFRLSRPVADNNSDDNVPVTSQPCRWKGPRKRKESTMCLSDATFEKHDYKKPLKRTVKHVEDFDPRPEIFRGTAPSRIPELLQKLKGEQPCISLLFYPQHRHEKSHQPATHSFPNTGHLRETVSAFKKSLEVTAERAREIERNTREQSMSPLWFSVRRYRITASLFGSVLSRRPETLPDSLVLRIIQPKNLSTPATSYGLEKESTAIKDYVSYQQCHGHVGLVVAASGVIINPSYCFLGASPDGAVYDPVSLDKPFGFLEVKCPYSTRSSTPIEACGTSGFFCTVDAASGQLKLKESHQYYAQIQGQMAIGERPWCDFVVFTLKGISIQRIPFDQDFWTDKLFPRLETFYNDCVAPELVSPVHALGLPLRNLSWVSK